LNDRRVVDADGRQDNGAGRQEKVCLQDGVCSQDEVCRRSFVSLEMEEVALRGSRNELGLIGKAVDWGLNLQ
jgi:hypothetical protein